MSKIEELSTEFNKITKLFFEILAEARYILQKSEFHEIENIINELKTFHEKEQTCLENLKKLYKNKDKNEGN